MEDYKIMASITAGFALLLATFTAGKDVMRWKMEDEVRKGLIEGERKGVVSLVEKLEGFNLSNSANEVYLDRDGNGQYDYHFVGYDGKVVGQPLLKEQTKEQCLQMYRSGNIDFIE